MITAEEIDLLAEAVVRKQRALQRLVLNRPEARVYTGQESDSAFDRWCAKWGVRPVAHGRYSRRWLDRGLEKEAASGRRRMPKESTQSEEKHAA